MSDDKSPLVQNNPYTVNYGGPTAPPPPSETYPPQGIAAYPPPGPYTPTGYHQPPPPPPGAYPPPPPPGTYQQPPPPGAHPPPPPPPGTGGYTPYQPTPYPPSTSTDPIIISGAAVPPALYGYPVNMVCPHCGCEIVTKLSYKTGVFAYIICLIMCLFVCLFGLIALCIDGLKDVIHTCPNCNRIIGVYKRC